MMAACPEEEVTTKFSTKQPNRNMIIAASMGVIWEQGLSNHIYYRVDDISGLHHHTDAGSKSHLHHTWNNPFAPFLKDFAILSPFIPDRNPEAMATISIMARHHILSPVQGYGAPYEKSESTKGQNHDYKVNPSQLYIEIRMIDSLKTFHIRSVQQALCFIFHNPAGVANGIDK